MSNKRQESRLQALELQLEEALQMLRLVSKNCRTCLEVEEWLSQNHPEDENNREIVTTLIGTKKKRKTDVDV